MNPTTKTYRGRALAEVLPQIREELGEDAVIVAQREDAEGGVGGFFARRVVEVEARAGGEVEPEPVAPSLLDVRADEPAGPESDAAPVSVPVAGAPSPATEGLAALFAAGIAPDEETTGVDAAVDEEPSFEEHLKALLRDAQLPPAPAEQPVVVPQVAEIPRPDPIVIVPLPEVVEEAPVAAAPVVPAPVAPEPEAVVEPAPPVPAAPTLAEAASLFCSVEPVAAVEPEPEPDPEPAANAIGTDVELVPACAPAATAATGATLTRTSDLAVRDELEDMGFTHALATALVEETVTHLVPLARDPSLVPLVQKALASRIPTHAVRGAGGRVIGFVGPGGSGKTRCVARLATAYARRSPLPVACVTLRADDEGAELRGLLGPVDVAVHAEPDAESAARRIAALRDGTIVLLDTPGVSPRAEAELRVLAAELAQLRADEIHVAVPATASRRAAREIVAGSRAMRPAAIAITHADETEALGTVVELAMDTGLPLSFVGRGHRVDVGLRPADATELALALCA